MGKRDTPLLVWRLGIVIALAIPAGIRAEQLAPSLPVLRADIPADLPSQFLGDQVFGPIGDELNLVGRTLNCPRRPAVSRSSNPLRQITMVDGDRVLAEIRRWEEEEVELRLRGGQSVSVPRAAIAEIGVPTGEMELLYDSFDSDINDRGVSQQVVLPSIGSASLETRHSFSGTTCLNVAHAPVIYSFTETANISRLQFWFRVDTLLESTKTSEVGVISPVLQVDFHFLSKEASAWNLVISEGLASLADPGRTSTVATKQDVTIKKGWHCLTAVFRPDHALCAIDDSLLVMTSPSPGKLGLLRLAATAGWIDDLQISQSRPDTVSAARSSTQDDCMTLQNGDQWFGRVTQMTADSVAMTGPAGDRTAQWYELDAVTLRQSNQSVASGNLPVGLWATIELQPYLDRPQQPPDRITAVITQVQPDCIVVVHPWLGRFLIAWSHLARIEPKFFGKSITIDARRLHLGDAIRSDFQRPVPDGAAWSVGFELAGQALPPNAEVWLSLNVVGLEPSGPETPPASPFLKALREGKLLTEITINGKQAGDLNRWIRFRALPDRPEQLRCQLSASDLRNGANVLHLRQRPLKEATVFDNCELSNLRIEIVDPAMTWRPRSESTD